jgi:tyrosyl-tRNA synthetase
MQVADIFYLDVDIAHAGMEQRKAHVVMRDVADKVAPGKSKPIALHHNLLTGLQKPLEWPIPEGKDVKEVLMEMKMSKSKSDSAIWVHDTPEEIQKKITKAFCPEKEVQYNPILNWTKNIFFWNRTEPFVIKRKPEHGGDATFQTYKELETAYAAGEVHPMDLKATVAEELITLLAPVREHFAKPEIAAKKEQLDKLLANK